MSEGPSARRYMESASAALGRLAGRAEAVDRLGDCLVGVIRGGGKILACGNGGSAAEALHFCEELVGRYRAKRRPVAAVCLSADATVLTCIANDYGYEEVFARQVEALGRAGDALVALSTSGRSVSIVRALERGRALGLKTAGLLGPAGSPAEAHCDISVTLPGEAASHVQEAHLAIIHALLERIDAEFGDEAGGRRDG